MTRQMTMGIRVRIKRKELGLTQVELARKSGLTQATISRVENCEIQELRSGAIMALALALRVTTDFLIGMKL